MTKPLNITGATTLQLNVDAGPGGFVSAELLAPGSTAPIPGYSPSRRINTNSVRATVRWGESTLLPRSTSVVRLRLRMQAAIARGESAIKCPSPLNALKVTHDHSCYRAREDEYQHLMTDSPGARRRSCTPSSLRRTITLGF